MNATVEHVRMFRAGPAGQLKVLATVVYPEEGSRYVVFVGSVYGGPVLMCTDGNPDGTWVTDPDRFGKFGIEWVRRFFQ